MNPEAQAYLDAILKKNPEELNHLELTFLRARRDYLKKSQLEEYKDVLFPNKEVHDGNKSDSYKELFEKAKGLGYTGRFAKAEVLEEYIKTHSA